MVEGNIEPGIILQTCFANKINKGWTWQSQNSCSFWMRFWIPSMYRRICTDGNSSFKTGGKTAFAGAPAALGGGALCPWKPGIPAEGWNEEQVFQDLDQKNLNPQRLYRHFYPSLPTQPHHKKAHGTTSVSERGGISAEWFSRMFFCKILPYFQPFGLINELSDDLWFLVVRSWDLSIPAPSSLPPAMDWTSGRRPSMESAMESAMFPDTWYSADSAWERLEVFCHSNSISSSIQ